MRFLDANVIIFAVLRPKKSLPDAVMQRKAAARDIFLRVNSGEQVITTTVHLSEVANVLEDAAGVTFASDLLGAILTKPSLHVAAVTADDYHEAVALSKTYAIGVNDALALVIMEQRGIGEIYTFDRHFGNTPVHVVQE